MHPSGLLIAFVAQSLVGASALPTPTEFAVKRVEGIAFQLGVVISALSTRERIEDHLNGALAEITRTEAELQALEQRLASANGQPISLPLHEFELLAQALGVCRWSEGVVNPSAGELYELLGLRRAVSGWPSPELLEQRSRPCEVLALNPQQRTAQLRPPARLELFPFEAGWAVDRATALLRAARVDNFLVRVGPVARAEGPGPEGRGWPFELRPEVVSWGLDPFWLRHQAAALLTRDDPPLQVPGVLQTPYVDLRNGKPASGLLAVAVVTREATDARAIAQAMFALGPTRGQLFVGSLSPPPSILWLLGSAGGETLRVATGWSRVSLP